jgi:hypothetical protein
MIVTVVITLFVAIVLIIGRDAGWMPRFPLVLLAVPAVLVLLFRSGKRWMAWVLLAAVGALLLWAVLERPS